MPPRKEPAVKLIDKVEQFAESLRKEAEFQNFPFRIDRDGRGKFHSLTVRAPKGDTLGKKFGKSSI